MMIKVGNNNSTPKLENVAYLNFMLFSAATVTKIHFFKPLHLEKIMWDEYAKFKKKIEDC